MFLLVVVAGAVPVRAGPVGTVWVGFDSASAPRPTIAVAFGRAPRPVGFEIEYAGTVWRSRDMTTAVNTIVISWLVKTPLKIRQAPIYIAAGLGAYGEVGGGSNSGAAGTVHLGAGA